MPPGHLAGMGLWWLLHPLLPWDLQVFLAAVLLKACAGWALGLVTPGTQVLETLLRQAPTAPHSLLLLSQAMQAGFCYLGG